VFSYCVSRLQITRHRFRHTKCLKRIVKHANGLMPVSKVLLNEIIDLYLFNFYSPLEGQRRLYGVMGGQAYDREKRKTPYGTQHSTHHLQIKENLGYCDRPSMLLKPFQLVASVGYRIRKTSFSGPLPKLFKLCPCGQN